MTLKPIKRVLVYRTGHLGDTICAIPAFRLLREQFRDSRLSLLCDRAVASKVSAERVISPLGIFDAVETYRSGQGLSTLWSMSRRVREIQPQIVIILAQVRETTASLTRKIRFFRWCGVNDVRGVNFPALPHAWQPDESSRLLQVLRALGIRGKKPAYAIPIDAAALDSVREKLLRLGIRPGAPFLVFCGGGKEPTQRWELARFAKVLQEVSAHFHLPIVAIGNEPEYARYRAEILPIFPGLLLAGSLSLPEMFELMREASAYLGNDTGPMHVAAAVECPVAAVISARNSPGSWDPDVQPRAIFRHRTDCEDCFLSRCYFEKHRCMTDITEQQVLAGLTPFLRPLLNRAA